jgi:hypothetical protein
MPGRRERARFAARVRFIAAITTEGTIMVLTPKSNDMPAESRSDGFRFLGEQDGPFERILKERLVDMFRDEAAVRRTYLARADFGDGSGSHVALGLRVSGVQEGGQESGQESGETRRLAGKVGAVFSSLFGAQEHLDILFISAPHEARLRKVCKPFFVRD